MSGKDRFYNFSLRMGVVVKAENDWRAVGWLSRKKCVVIATFSSFVFSAFAVFKFPILSFVQ